MANQGAKKRKEGNRQHMANLQRLIIACNVIYILLKLVIFYSSFSWKHCIGLMVTSLAYWISYQQLANMAKPTYSDGGELLDGGFDMATGGICGYLHDVIYITSFVQLTSIISDKFWFTYLLIPAFGAYKSFGLIKGLLSHGSEDGVEDEKTRKKREKMEKKAARGKIIKRRIIRSFGNSFDIISQLNHQESHSGNRCRFGENMMPFEYFSIIIWGSIYVIQEDVTLLGIAINVLGNK